MKFDPKFLAGLFAYLITLLGFYIGLLALMTIVSNR